MITTAHKQEGLSRSFLHALAATAGANISVNRSYDYGIDCTVNPVSDGPRHVETGFPIEFQLKSTINWVVINDHIQYDLEVKTYNDIVSRHKLAIPLYLALMCLPKKDSSWFVSTEKRQIIKKCCYYFKPEGPVSANRSTVRISIPRKNLLTPDSLNSLLAHARTAIGA